MDAPKWDKAPVWARYYAVDPDGAAYWFEKTPSSDMGYWLSSGKHKEAPDPDRPPKDWQLALWERPGKPGRPRTAEPVRKRKKKSTVPAPVFTSEHMTLGLRWLAVDYWGHEYEFMTKPIVCPDRRKRTWIDIKGMIGKRTGKRLSNPYPEWEMSLRSEAHTVGTIKAGDQVMNGHRNDGKVWTVEDILPGDLALLSRKPDPWEEVWGGYQSPRKTALEDGVKKVFCQTMIIFLILVKKTVPNT